MLAILLSQIPDRLLSALLLQTCKDFKLYVPSPDMLDHEGRLNFTRGGLTDVEEPLVCFLDADSLPDKDFVRRILRTARRHPDFDVYHVNLAQGPDYPRKIKAAKLFRLVVQQGLPAPLPTFIFRTPRLKEKAVFRADSSLDPLPTILAAMIVGLFLGARYSFRGPNINTRVNDVMDKAQAKAASAVEIHTDGGENKVE